MAAINQSINQSINIVLNADVKYAEQVGTLLKSLCCYNSHFTVYLINKDYSAEWFNYTNQQLARFQAQIIDVKGHQINVSAFKTLYHIASETTYYRYFIPQLVPADQCLYLDCDLVVNGNLRHLFDVDMQNYPLAAVTDPIAKIVHQQHEFNAGVMLINNRYWREHGITQKLMDITAEKGDSLQCGDQEVLNILFENQWFKLNRGYNYQVGLDWMLKRDGKAHLLEDLQEQTPLIVHYSTQVKPWLPFPQDLVRFRHLYWYYYGLSWEQLAQPR